MTLRTCVDSVSLRPGARKTTSDQGKAPTPTHRSRGRGGACRELRLLENGREDERQCGRRSRAFGSIETSSVNSCGRFPNRSRTRTKPAQAGESSQAGANHPAGRARHPFTNEIHVRDVGLSHQIVSIAALGWSVEPVLDGEFDPGSGRTLAACLTHASRTRSMQSQDCGRSSGERVRNT